MKPILSNLRHGALDLSERSAAIGQTCFAGLREVASGVIDHLEAIPRSLAASTTFALLAFSLGALVLFSASCAHTLPGLEREQSLYQTGTNVVGQLNQLAPYLPPPVGNTMQIVLAIASSLLATWNLHQQGELRKLRNGHGSGPATLPQPPPAPDLLAQPAAAAPSAQ